MNFQDTIKKQRKKVSFKRKMKSALQKFLWVVIGIPWTKTENAITKMKDNYWLKNQEKCEKKVLADMIEYIQKYMVRYKDDSFRVYNHYEFEEIRYSNALHIHNFFGWDYKSKAAKRFKKLFIQTTAEKDLYYDKFYKNLYNYFSKYNDMSVEYTTEQVWSRKIDCFDIKLK